MPNLFETPTRTVLPHLRSVNRANSVYSVNNHNKFGIRKLVHSIMADKNSYLRYKQDTRHLLYWMIHTSNSIIESSSPIPDAAPTTVNTTGKITVSALVPLSKLIAKRTNPIPSIIYRLFQSVIAARAATHTLFQQIVAKKPDPEIEKSNVSHKRFIDALTEAFNVLGGEGWVERQKDERNNIDDDNVDEVVFANKFSALDIGRPKDGEEVEDAVEGGSDGQGPPVCCPLSQFLLDTDRF
jgi:hypothetical protein